MIEGHCRTKRRIHLDRLSRKQCEQVRDGLVGSRHRPISTLGVPPASCNALDLGYPVRMKGEDDLEASGVGRGDPGWIRFLLSLEWACVIQDRT